MKLGMRETPEKIIFWVDFLSYCKVISSESGAPITTTFLLKGGRRP